MNDTICDHCKQPIPNEPQHTAYVLTIAERYQGNDCDKKTLNLCAFCGDAITEYLEHPQAAIVV